LESSGLRVIGRITTIKIIKRKQQYDITKAADRKSIVMQIAKPRPENEFPYKDTGLPYQCQ
jgi:hypothetical protein